jgi:hypothetical protein
MIKKFDEFLISENMEYHIDNKLSVIDNIFRPGSESYISLIREGRKIFDSGVKDFSELDRRLFETTDLGKFGIFNGITVPLDMPMFNDYALNEAEYKGKTVNLNKPMRSSGPKKYKVYVKNPKSGKVICVNFGDVKGGLTTKINNPKARKAFAQRHQCHLKKDKTKPGYWSCNLPRYGLVGKVMNTYW